MANRRFLDGGDVSFSQQEQGRHPRCEKGERTRFRDSRRTDRDDVAQAVVRQAAAQRAVVRRGRKL